jgi:hypothetical protein
MPRQQKSFEPVILTNNSKLNVAHALVRAASRLISTLACNLLKSRRHASRRFSTLQTKGPRHKSLRRTQRLSEFSSCLIRYVNDGEGPGISREKTTKIVIMNKIAAKNAFIIVPDRSNTTESRITRS